MENEPELTKLGGTIQVPWVQDLAKHTHDQLPARYDRSTDEDSPVIADTGSLPQLPIIDLQKLVSEDVEMERFHNACKEWGFFQLVNHGVSNELVEKVKVEVKKFFDLPMEEKKKFWQRPGDLQGFGQAFVVSEQKLNWGDMFYMITLPPHLRKPYLLPEFPTSLRETIEAYSTELKKLQMKLLYLMANALKIDQKDITDLFEEGLQGMRMNYYPPCPRPDRAIGLNSHSDSVGFTILLQINEVEGLQIKKDQNWIPVNPLPGAFVINIGDILEIITNGTYPSIQHRASVNSEKERLSIATFYSPNLAGDMGPAPSLITPETPAQFKRIGVADYFKGYYARELKDKSYIDVMRIPNQNQNQDPSG